MVVVASLEGRDDATRVGEIEPPCASDTSRTVDEHLQPACRDRLGPYTQSVRAEVRRGESNDSYHTPDGYLNCSPAKTFAESVRLYYARYVAKTLPPLSGDAVNHGSILHEWWEANFCDGFLATLAVPPESTLTTTGQIGKDAKQYCADNFPAGAKIVSPKEIGQLRRERDALLANPAFVELNERVVDRELSVRWEHDGRRLKCKYDALTDEFALDLKTTREEDIIADFHDAVVRFKYHLQDAWYQCGMAAMGMTPQPIRFIVISTAASHDCQVVTLPQQVIDAGRRLMDKTLADLRIREDLDWWLPETHGEVVELPFPAHALRRL
jgi:hypothetical protein